MSDKSERALQIEQDEMLILFDQLHRWLDDQHGRTIRGAIADDAELWALNALNGALERCVSEAFRADYRTLVDAARTMVRNKNGGEWPRPG